MKKTKETTVKEKYSVTVSLGGKKYKGDGVSVSDAIASVSIRNPKGRVIITVEHGGNTKDRILPQTQVNRLFTGHGLMREVALKQVSSLFDGV